MRHETISIERKGSVTGARMITYIPDRSPEMANKKKPFIIICPGGGYEMTSDREAEPIAFQYLAKGYACAVLRYSCKPAVFPTALLEVARAYVLAKENADNWNIDANNIFLQGFSAGGHLVCSYCTFYQDKLVTEATGYDAAALRPAGLILCYPVISSGAKAHKGTFESLLGDKYENIRDTHILKKLSLETQIHKDMPPVFVWHTFEDRTVPVENSLLLVSALKKKNIPTEFHMYPKGVHGLSLANEMTCYPDGGAVEKSCESWMGLALDWINNNTY